MARKYTRKTTMKKTGSKKFWSVLTAPKLKKEIRPVAPEIMTIKAWSHSPTKVVNQRGKNAVPETYFLVAKPGGRKRFVKDRTSMKSGEHVLGENYYKRKVGKKTVYSQSTRGLKVSTKK